MNTEDILGRYIKINGTRIHYDEMGSGIPIILIHTLHSCSLEYLYLLPLLASRGYHAIAPDLPGNSRSYPPKWIPIDSAHDMAEFLWSFSAAVCKDRKPAIAGCSIGGNITIDLVANHSKDILAGIAMEGAVYTPTVSPLDEFLLPAWLPSWQDWLERCVTESLNRNASRELVNELIWQHRFTSHHNGMPQAKCWTHHDLRGKLGKLACPLLVLAGSEDFYVPKELLEFTRHEIPQCETRILDGLGHYPMLEAPELVADIIDSFVRSAAMV
jgi:pimeloyl-ACP methyl ester carboxylesterase